MPSSGRNIRVLPHFCSVVGSASPYPSHKFGADILPLGQNIRNFVIISHVDHGKSTLADRLLEITGTVPKEKLVPQFLDRMPLERERGITIKMQPVRMLWHPNRTIDNLPFTIDQSSQMSHVKGQMLSGSEYILNLIDTPGHSDFSYEVSRGLAAVEGAVLLVDATKGVQAQTLANFQLARAERLSIIPAVNKIDLPTARIEETVLQIEEILGLPRGDVLYISGKTGQGVEELLLTVVGRVPPPKDDASATFRALIFDSHYDAHKGIIAYVRVFSGSIRRGEPIRFFHSGAEAKVNEVGVFRPDLKPIDALGPGEIGYIAMGLKEPALVKVGDTITKLKVKSQKLKVIERVEPFVGYKEPLPLVFASFYPSTEDDFSALKVALEKLHLNDAAFTFHEERSQSLGRGFRCGFLGTLHQEIVEERLKREYGQDVIVTQPAVLFEGVLKDGTTRSIHAVHEFDRGRFTEVREPWLKLTVLLPPAAMAQLIKLLPQYRGVATETATLSPQSVSVAVEIPLAEFFTDFAATLQSAVSGYASFSYEPIGMRSGELALFEILVHGVPQEAFSQIMDRRRAEQSARERVEKLKTLLPRQLFPVAIQAVIDGRILARETVPALRKDVTGHLYGGDFTRKAKLLKKQKKGKKALAAAGSVKIPPWVFRQMAR